MKKENTKSNEELELRLKAEELLKKKRVKKTKQISVPDTTKLIHELEVYQIELEMQNEELRRVRNEAKTAAERYNTLYEFTITGYFTLDHDGKIFWLNLNGAKMLGLERSKLVTRNFKSFVTLDTVSVFNDFFQKAYMTGFRESCEVRMITEGSSAIYVYIEGVVNEFDNKCVLTMIDITKRKTMEEILNLKNTELKHYNDLLNVSDFKMDKLKKEINLLLTRIGEKEKFKVPDNNDTK